MKTSKIWMGLCLVVVLAAALGLSGCPQKKGAKTEKGRSAAKKGEAITLGLGLDKGGSYVYEMTGVITVTQSMGDKKQTMPAMTMKMTQHLNVADDDSKDFNVSARLDGFAMEIPNLTDEIKQKIDAIYAAMNGIEFSFAVSPKGEIKSFKGMGSFMDHMAESMGNDPMSAQILKSMEQYMNDEQLIKQMGLLYNFGANARALHVGDTWDVDFPMPMVGTDEPLKLKIKYKLDEVKPVDGAKTAILSFDSKQDYGKDGVPFMQEMMKEMAPGMDLAIYLHEFNMKGKVTYDLDHNKLLQVAPDSTIRMRVVANLPEQGKQEINQTVVTEMSMDLAK